MGKKKDLTGMRFGRLIVVCGAPNLRDGRTAWKCRCDCGNEKVVSGKELQNGSTKSCGCLTREILIARNTKHGKRYTRLYRIWLMMKNRCSNSKDKFYKCYGGKGITVCDEWSKNFESFYNWAMSNGYASNLTLDRINTDLGYCPENCRWATAKQQANNKTTNHYLTYQGKTQSMAMWADEIGISYSTLRARVNAYHWDIEKALFSPVKGGRNEKK